MKLFLGRVEITYESKLTRDHHKKCLVFTAFFFGGASGAKRNNCKGNNFPSDVLSNVYCDRKWTRAIVLPAICKSLDKLGSLTKVWQLVSEKENFEFKPVKLRIKTDLVSHPDRAEGLGEYI